ncbi:type IX secretion system PorP/SprF family membrane protein [Ancylomarina subtilis]|uniref:Type IX secretion system PorP/SprF family membrane protein n=1 Tax=Ancylomarina subtilis TaxID=1639035 RepID=A0A4Q7VL89_9BACT|nr:PorP/SprF family type IX secretion system membrane protein [Ancylomarina subtilis]RZT96924.1 type IX secretion system PorP/SprF family membrane protein [Ancylomarina subtilis]
MNKLILSIIFFVFGISLIGRAQDIRFSQFYANKLYLNPALAGSSDHANLSLNYRNQWPNLDYPYVSYSVSYDNFFSGLNGGLGFLVMQDDQGDGAITTTSFSGAYSFFLRINNELVFRPAIQASVIQKKLNFKDLRFPDQISPIYGDVFPHNTSGDPSNRSWNGMDFSVGIMAYYKNYYFGAAASHVNQPNLSFDDFEDDQLNAKYTFHAGAEFALSGQTRGNGLVLSPALLFQKQGEFTQMNYGMYVSKSSLVFGFWFNQNFQLNYDAVILMAGIVTDRFKLAYSFDYTITKLVQTNTGAHELSFSFPLAFEKRKRRRRPNRVRYPQF